MPCVFDLLKLSEKSINIPINKVETWGKENIQLFAYAPKKGFVAIPKSLGQLF